ncbi:MAG: prepilin-type N-terminal cleavage/methylation domain-containing protein [Elusimicrobiota bacterium]|jgi:prepilin-type N-terminal cleavage/methylation domain-containing protein|nr:prepilin-type N-terminal cleavage/methylation domain-containing protein [Elusimicrobiota bacterium]
MRQKITSGKGFTLIELLITILIIMVLAGYSIFTYMELTEDASKAKAKATLELINSAIERFKLEYPNQTLTGDFTDPDDGKYPCEKGDTNPARRLIGCRYLEKMMFDFDNADYIFTMGSGCGGDGYAYMQSKSGNYCAGISMNRGGKAIDGIITASSTP